MTQILKTALFATQIVLALTLVACNEDEAPQENPPIVDVAPPSPPTTELQEEVEVGPKMTFLLGDLNEDGCVNAADTDLFIQRLLGDFVPTRGQQDGDYNRDGLLDGEDSDQATYLSDFDYCQPGGILFGAGDLDKDGCVTNSDFDLFQAALSTSGTVTGGPLVGDFNSDGEVDGEDIDGMLYVKGRCY